MEVNNFDNSIKKKMEARTIAPSADAWQKLEAMITVADQPKRNYTWLYMAASFVGFLLVATFFFKDFESNNVKKNIPVVVVEANDSEVPKKNASVVKQEKVPLQTVATNRAILGVAIRNNERESEPKQQKNQNLPALVPNQEPQSHNSVTIARDKNIAVMSSNKYITAEQLLADVSNVKFEMKSANNTVEAAKPGYRVNPNSLLSTAEKELNQTFRESALERINEKFNAVKSALANRNYQE